jgi:hypothetical protein
MLYRVFIQAMICTTLSLILLAPAELMGQSSSYFNVLSLPPASVGTCVAARSNVTTSDVLSRESHLVITGPTLGRRREIAARENLNTGAISLMDVTYRATGVRTSVGDDVVAIIDSTGRIRGSRQKINVQVLSARRILDTLDLRALREHTVRGSSAKPLDTEQRHEVQHLVDWLRKRCPD